jgi:hypothetical protein
MMGLQLRSVPESGRERVAAFLGRIFKARGDAVFLQPAQLHWKYWQPRQDWPESRSYVYETEGGDIAAHACVWPFALRTMQGIRRGTHPIDWAADAKVPGAGILLLHEIREMRDLSCCIGGTEVAQRVVAGSGFSRVSEVRHFVRPLRPLRNMLTHQRRDWKLPARFARNLAWKLDGKAAIPAGWSCTRVEPEEIPDSLLPAPEPGLAVASRSAALFRYMLSCPVASHQMWMASYQQTPRGYFMLSFPPGQARLADAWVTGQSPDAWRAIFTLASSAARENASVAEIVIATSLQEAATGAEAAGFRPCREIAIMLFDPHKYLAESPRIHVQMIENDTSFLHDNRIEYLT